MTAVIPRARRSERVTLFPGDSFPARVHPIPGWKRTIDVLCASAGLIVVAPFVVLICLAIVLDSRGSPFFRQTRVGQGGRLFKCWKFRSMLRNAESMLPELMGSNEANGHIFKMQDDPRRTRVGKILRKTSLDELPQFWNVLVGDMSMVGPRPPTSDEVMGYATEDLRRLSVVPGITGLWQVTLRGRHDFTDMVALDIEYAERLSPWLDMRILFMTVPTVLFGKGSC